MTNPYNRIVQTPAEKRAAQARAEFKRATSPEGMAELQTQWEQENYAVFDPMFTPTPTDSPKTFEQLRNPPYFRDPMFDVDRTDPSHPQYEQEKAWYQKGNLPHIPGLSQVGSTVRDAIATPFTDRDYIWGSGPSVWDMTKGAIGFAEKYISQPIGSAATAIEGPSLLGLAGVPGFRTEGQFNLGQLPIPGTDWREVYQRDTPIGSRILAEVAADPLNLPILGLIPKSAKALTKVGKSAEANNLIQQAEEVRRLNDPHSLFYRHVATNLEEGQKQVIIVSNSYPQGRRITVNSDAWQDADNAIDVAVRGEAEGGYKILPGDASRAEVIKASGALLPDTSQVLPPPQARRTGARGFEAVRTGRGNISPRLIADDVPAFVSKEISAAEKAEFLSSYRAMMPQEVSYLDDAGQIIPVTRKVTPNPRGTVSYTHLTLPTIYSV